jgi:hypothetical protein
MFWSEKQEIINGLSPGQKSQALHKMTSRNGNEC